MIGDNVEIGAGSCIDRGAIEDTRIGNGTKLDNLVHVGHNVTIGRHCLVAGQVGFAGSAVVGDFVAIGGQAGISDHIHLGPGSQIGAASAVLRDVPAGEKWPAPRRCRSRPGSASAPRPTAARRYRARPTGRNRSPPAPLPS